MAIAGVFGLASTVLKAGDQDFTVVNKTGFEIHSIHVAPHSSDEWGEDIMGKDTLDDGESVEIVFARKEKAAKWDLRVSDGEKHSFVWESLNLLEISEVTLFYKKGVATATFK
jgi:hypothetical protein